MKKKDTILILGVVSILILIAAQLIIIRGVWKQKDEMLFMRYRTLSQEAIGSLWGQRTLDPYDTVKYILDKESEKWLNELPLITDSDTLAEKKSYIFWFVTKALNDEQDMSGYLSAYFEKQGIEKDFNHRIVITRFYLIDLDTIKIYGSGTMGPRRSQGREPLSTDLQGSKSSILVYRPHIERNYFLLDFEYYIDFADKKMMIFREISASLLISVFSIVVVVVIFIVAYHNLMEEKRLSNLKTDFINNMTHELKTPLATITVAGKTLEMDQIRSDGSKVLDTAKLIGKQSIHLNQLINMILEISMWERTQFQLDKKKVPIEELMNDIVNSFKTGYGNNAELIQKYNFNGVNADVDVVYFTTLINNLLSNAVKYSEKVPVIYIDGIIEEKNICISISDNGIGINKIDQKHVFDKFYRASSGNIHKYKGLGLGLYYVKKIALAHGGDVAVSSKPGKGSIFTVTLPY